MPREPLHLHPTAPLADRVLLPGDPGRALLLAQELLDAPKMFNHNRGLWGYTGAAKADGEPLTVQSTGMGGPSAAIVLTELASLGVERAVRVGTCMALAPSLSIGDVVVVTEARGVDGVSSSFAAGSLTPDPTLLGRLSGDAAGAVVSRDVFYDASREPQWRAAGALAVDLETAALFAVGASLGVAVASAVAVTSVAGSVSGPLPEEEQQRASERVGRVGVAALLR